jgi:hypothetical protein
MIGGEERDGEDCRASNKATRIPLLVLRCLQDGYEVRIDSELASIRNEPGTCSDRWLFFLHLFKFVLQLGASLFLTVVGFETRWNL